MSIALLDDSTLSTCPVVTSTINYLGDMDVLPVFYAQHRERDNLILKSYEVEIYGARVAGRMTRLSAKALLSGYAEPAYRRQQQ